MERGMDLSSRHLAFIGAGNMGRAILQGLLDQGAASPGNVTVRTRRPERSAELAEKLGVEVAANAADAARGADIVVLAVKPQILPQVLDELQGVNNEALYISVAAGVSTQTIESILGPVRVVRAMPNTPALIGEGATAISSGSFARGDDLALAKSIFDRVGLTVIVEEEHLDAVTGLSGSGPAYLMLIIEAFADAGVKVGLHREIAQALAVQMIRGSARLQQVTGAHPGQLKDQVTSPGGTAIAGLHTLEQGGLRTTIINAVEEATRRARELGRRG
jgi:pyrroline-5-carboxylate reductase